MDRRNNLIDVSIGQIARTFEEVLEKARAVMDRSPADGSGGILGAVWLPREQWAGQERRAALRAERRADWLRMLEEVEAENEAAGGEVDVRAYLRRGRPVRAHSRSAPD